MFRILCGLVCHQKFVGWDVYCIVKKVENRCNIYRFSQHCMNVDHSNPLSATLSRSVMPASLRVSFSLSFSFDDWTGTGTDFNRTPFSLFRIGLCVCTYAVNAYRDCVFTTAAREIDT